MSAEEMSGDEQEVNEIARSRKWINNSGNYNQKHDQISIIIVTVATDISNSDHRKTNKQNSGRRSRETTLTTLSQDHYVPAQFSSDFFKKLDLAMKLKWDELNEQRASSRQVNEIIENNFIQAFGMTEDQMDKAAAMLDRSKSTKNLGDSSGLTSHGKQKEVSDKGGVRDKYR